MKIGLIVHPYGEKKAAGLGRAIFSLAKNIIELNPQNEYIFFVKGTCTQSPEIKGNNWRVVELPTHVFWLDSGLKKYKNLDCYLFFTPVLPLFFRPRNSIVIVHDLGYKVIPASSIKEFLIRKILHFLHKWSLQKATKVVAISEYTKTQIIKYFNTPKHLITVIYNGFQTYPLSDNTNDLQENPYILFVGVLKKRKNVISLVEAYGLYISSSALKKAYIPQLYLVGKGGGSYYKKLLKTIERLNLSSHVVLKGYISDQQLGNLYKNSRAFVFPSLLEGFGLPVLEAMNIGVPVVTSNSSSLGEIGKDAAVLVDPYNIYSIAEGIKKVVEDNELRIKLIEQGKMRAGLFSWEKSAKEYSRLIHSIVQHGKF